jgi:hypothetical protein
MVQIDRRGFLGRSLVIAGAAVAGGPLAQALNLRAAAAGRNDISSSLEPGTSGYGPLVAKQPVAAGAGADPSVEWIALPEAFAEQYLKGLTRKGQIFDLALNLVENKEWGAPAGAPTASTCSSTRRARPRRFPTDGPVAPTRSSGHGRGAASEQHGRSAPGARDFRP